MNHDDLDRKFKRGLGLCRKGQVVDAAVVFRDLIESGSEEPLHLSYHGLLTATVHGLRREGLQYSQRAMQFGASEPDVASNLARLYELNGQPRKAVETLRRGLRENPGHARLVGQIDRLSPRKKPPLSMVDRNHAINKHLAILAAKISGRYKKQQPPARRQLKPRRA